MATLVDSNTSTSGQGAFPNHDSATVGNPQVVCQVFTASENYELDQISVLLNRNGYVPGNVRCSIYATLTNEPTGAALDTAEVVASTLLVTPSKSYIVFNMTGGVNLVSGTSYAIVINALSANPTATGFTNVFYSNTAITGGLIFSNDGESSWDTTYFATLDCNFRTYKPDAAPTKATNPSPADDATDEDFSGLELSWDDGGGSDTYNVYIGKTGTLTTPVSSAQVGTTYTTTMAELAVLFDVGDDPIEQKIYWRIDSTNDVDTTTGDEWNFDPRPKKASVPSPATTATGIVLGLTATWTGSDIADTFDTYANIGAGLVVQSAGLESATWTPTPTIFSYITEYTWRVDSTNAFGTTTGDEWTFTTLRFDPPSQTHYYPTTGQYYYLLVQSDAPLGDVPGVGVENTDYVFLAAGYEYNPMATMRRLVAAAENRIWYESI